MAMTPEWVIASLAGLTFGGGGGVSVCGESCTDSCGNTCGDGSCFGTCYSSCDNTCGSRSCDITTQLGGFRNVGDPAFENMVGIRPFRAWRR
jgi:hypothetical protein